MYVHGGVRMCMCKMGLSCVHMYIRVRVHMWTVYIHTRSCSRSSSLPCTHARMQIYAHTYMIIKEYAKTLSYSTLRLSLYLSVKLKAA
jgi:hypothetical protein